MQLFTSDEILDKKQDYFSTILAAQIVNKIRLSSTIKSKSKKINNRQFIISNLEQCNVDYFFPMLVKDDEAFWQAVKRNKLTTKKLIEIAETILKCPISINMIESIYWSNEDVWQKYQIILGEVRCQTRIKIEEEIDELRKGIKDINTEEYLLDFWKMQLEELDVFLATF
jgi:hypothetical protein